MKPITAVVPFYPDKLFDRLIINLSSFPLIERVLIIGQYSKPFNAYKVEVLSGEPIHSTNTLIKILQEVKTDFLLIVLKPQIIYFESEALEKLLKCTKDHRGAMVYSDFYEELNDKKIYVPLNDYQIGSVRDDFEFGNIILLSTAEIKKTLKKYGLLLGLRWGSIYDLRLKLSIENPIIHLNEPLYTVVKNHEEPFIKKLYSYVDPKNLKIQKEMEFIFTEYLKKIGAYIPHYILKKVEKTNDNFPVEASIIIPVKDRQETISDAIRSALSQQADFPFNVIVVNNHSKDETTSIVSRLAKKDSRIKHIIPIRDDLGIGGCWNEALNSIYCGRYAIQLDSDDLYSTPHTLKKMVNMLSNGEFAMVIGSYTLVDSNLKEIPPGFIDHREWTDENGHNNALRINGLGAPRGFNTALIRKIGFLNVSYGEDYAIALRISREFKIGRIYENLYLCRRWTGNSDSNLSHKDLNQKNAFKDLIRTEEISFRQRLIKGII